MITGRSVEAFHGLGPIDAGRCDIAAPCCGDPPSVMTGTIDINGHGLGRQINPGNDTGPGIIGLAETGKQDE